MGLIPGYNTNGMAHHRLPEALELIRGAGFRAVALTLDIGHLDPLRATAAEVAATARQLRELELTCVVETGGRYLLDPRRKHRPNLLEEEAGERQQRLDLLLRSLAIARDLGAGVVSFWSGVVPEGVTEATARVRLAEGVDRLLAAAKERGLRLALEPEPGHLVERVAQWRELAGSFPDPAFGLCLDLGHLAANREGGLAEVLTPADVPRLYQVHLEDARPGLHLHLEPGEGELDFPALLAILARRGYRGPVCWELSRSSHRAPQALAAAWQWWTRSQ